VVATAHELGISEDAARKRLSYALGVLRGAYAKRGVRLGAGALAALALAETAAAECGVVAAATGLASLSGLAMAALITGGATVATVTGALLWPQAEAPAAPSPPPPIEAAPEPAVPASTQALPPPQPRLPVPGARVLRQRLLAQQAFDPQGMSAPPTRAVLWLGRPQRDLAAYTWSEPAPVDELLPEARFRIADLPRFLADLDGPQSWLGAPVQGADLMLVAVWPASLGVIRRAGLPTDHGDVWWLSLGLGQRQRAMGLVQIHELGPAPAGAKPLHVALRQQGEVAPGWLRSSSLLVASALVQAPEQPPPTDRPLRLEPGLMPAPDPAASDEGPVPQALEFMALPTVDAVGLALAARREAHPPEWSATGLGRRALEALRGHAQPEGAILAVVTTPALPYHADGVPVARYRPLRRNGDAMTIAVDIWMAPPAPQPRRAHLGLVLALPPSSDTRFVHLDLRMYRADTDGYRLEAVPLGITTTLPLPGPADRAQ
jgi:hypothetical protein